MVSPQLSHCELAVARGCDGVAVVSIGRMASAVAHDPRGLLALDIAVDARHPGADLVREHPLTEGQDVIGPFSDTGGSGFDPGQPVFFRVPNDAGHPLDAVFRGSRV